MNGVRVLFADGTMEEYPTANSWQWHGNGVSVSMETVDKEVCKTITKDKKGYVINSVSKDHFTTKRETIATFVANAEVIGVEGISQG